MITVALIAASALSSSPARDPTPRALAVIEGQVKANRFSGAVLVVRDGRPLLRQAWGLADREWSVPNTPKAKFRIGSLTKQFTAAAILQLQEAGKLSIDDPISKYYPAAPAAWSKVTIKHLLSHRSGIPSFTEIPDLFPKAGHVSRTPEEIVALTRDRPLEFEPGTKFSYDNTGYVLLGMVIEKASGESYAGYLAHHIFKPLGLGDTGYDISAEVLPLRARGYDVRNGEVTNTDYLDMTLPYAAGALYSTVDDLATWEAALQGGKVIGPASLAAMFTDRGDGYGFGEAVGTRFGRTRYAHAGGINGFVSELDYLPAERLTVVVLANQSNSAPEMIASEIEAAYLGLPVRRADPRTEAALRATIEALRRGEPDYATMTPALADVTRRQLPGLEALIAGFGRVRTIALVRAEASGVDVYRVAFDTSAVEWRVRLDRDGRMVVSAFQPADD